MPGYQNFIFSNGKQTEVVYKHDVGRFCGLNKFWSMEGIEDLSSFNLALFSYEEPGVTTVSFFDYDFVEYMFPGTPLSSGNKTGLLILFCFNFRCCFKVMLFNLNFCHRVKLACTSCFWTYWDHCPGSPLVQICVWSGKKIICSCILTNLIFHWIFVFMIFYIYCSIPLLM